VNADVGLMELRKKLKAIASGELRRSVLVSLAEEARKEIVRSFHDSKDPYGVSWKPLRSSRRRQGHTPRGDRPLQDTGNMRNALTVSAPPRSTDRALIINAPVSYAGFHQHGTKYIPRRQFVPEGSLGPIWTKSFKRATDSAMKVLMGGRRG
jgi:phage gpG-like protein